MKEEREEMKEEREEMKEAKDPLMKYPAYVKALEFYEYIVEDIKTLMKDVRGCEIARQLIKAGGSISANFEEGYGRGTTQEFIHRLRISTGEARECRGWYIRAKGLLSEKFDFTENKQG
ncbi:MAG: four helix bundle protein [Candidatus Stahlbacteria bacterium]|nr:four helix bundle protein [Candidatus Stahlbacteria bacterium]